MNALIHIYTNTDLGGETLTVNARDLHAFLEVKTRFNDWIKNRIEKYEFVAGRDFVALTENLVSGGTRTDNHLTLDMAKELAMVENNAKGREARRYFIEAEKQLRAAPQIDYSDPRQVLKFAEAQIAAKEEAEARLAEAQPKVHAFERLEASEGSVNLTTAAKELRIPPRRLNTWLLVNGWLYRRAGSNSLTAYQGKITSGYLEHKPHTYTGSDGVQKTNDQVMVTPKGLARLAKMLSPPQALAA